MKEMKTLGGYEIVDGKARDDIALMQSKMLDFVTPEMFGALGGGSDDTHAIQAAIDKGIELGKPIYLSQRYITTGTICISGKRCNVYGNGTIVYTGAGDAVRVVGDSHNIQLSCIEAERGTGIVLDGTLGYTGDNLITIQLVYAAIGLKITTAAKSITSNRIEIHRISATDIGVLVWADSSFINENHYYIDYITGGCNVGIYLHADETLNHASGYGTNDNKFFNTRIEGIKTEISGTSTYTENLTQTCAILIENSHGNVFRAFRTQESCGKKWLVFKGDCNRNNIELSDLNLTQSLDITALTNPGTALSDITKSRNVIKATRQLRSGDGYDAGYIAEVYGSLGFVYDVTRVRYTEQYLSPTTSPDNIIGFVNEKFSTLYDINDEACNGLTYTIDRRYSTPGTMMFGAPINIYLGSNSLVTIVDDKGQVVLDNTSGEYKWKTVSLRCVCYDAPNGKNRWAVIETQ